MSAEYSGAERIGAVAGVPSDGRALVRGVAGWGLRRESIAEALAALASDEPQRPAVMWSTDRGTADLLTWAQLYDRACRGAATLLRLNPLRSRVAIAAMNSVDWIVAMYACAVAGMPIVPVSASCTDEEARFQIGYARVGLVLAAVRAGNHRVLERLTEVAASLAAAPVVHDISQLDAAYRVEPITLSFDHEFLIQYTSGTTGRAKAASISHGAAVNCGSVFARAIGLGRSDRLLNPLPLHHVGGSVSGLISALAVGCAYILVEQFRPQLVIDSLRQTSPTVGGLVPTMMIDLLALPGVGPDDFASLRTVVGGATSVDPALILDMEQKLGVTVIGAYGQSEGPAMIASSLEDSIDVRMQTLGRCLVGRDFCIRDRGGAIVAIGEEGELCVRGPLTMSGYLQPDGGVDPAVDADGWRATGDLCSMNADGVITFIGRIREVVIRGGLNVYPAEVEQAISSHPDVADIAVFGVPDHRFGERVIAAVIPADGHSMDVTELAALAERRLSSYKRPSEWVVVSGFPRTSTGKVRKHVLRDWYEEGTLVAASPVPSG